MPLLNNMPEERANRVYLHPIHQANYRTVAELIVELRQCRSYEDYYHFQQGLLDKVLDVQDHRGACSRVATRLEAGRSVPANAPELRSGDESTDVESWRIEADACERVDRELRSIADAMAWRLFDFDRRAIITLSQNDPAGPMASKKGLSEERRFLTETWASDRHFALLHDLTSCLRIGDAAVFIEEGGKYEVFLHEIKTDQGRKRSPQRRRLRVANAAVLDGGPLPGEPGGRLVAVGVPYRTHLDKLAAAFDLARERGAQGMRIPGHRALIVANLHRGHELWSVNGFLDKTEAEYNAARRRAGILNVGNQAVWRSDDLAARAPTSPPWAIYPLPPDVCAGLIVDMAFYMVVVSGACLAAALGDAGIHAEWTVPEDQRWFEPGQVVMRVFLGGRGLEMRTGDLRRLLLELVYLETWVETIKAMLLHAGPEVAHPWPYYADEYKVWM